MRFLRDVDPALGIAPPRSPRSSVPSGEITGSATPGAKFVSCRGSPPSTGIVQSWLDPLRSS